MNRLYPFALAACLCSMPAHAEDKPLATLLGAPEALSISASVRARVETIDGQFRPNRAESDTMFSLKTTLAAEYDAGPCVRESAMNKLEVGSYERVTEGVYLEGLSYDFVRDVVWYSDVIAGGIHGVKPDGTKVASFNGERMWTGGVLMNDDGCVLSTGQGGIMWNDPDSGRSGWLLDRLEGQSINGINEMWPDGTGGIYFGTNDIASIIEAKDTKPTAIYRLTVDREVIKLDDGVYFSNGIGFDPQRRRFYCSDTFRTSWVWDVEDDLSLSNRRMLLDKSDCDGLALEASGNVLLTGFRSPGKITRVSPEGVELEPLLTPEGSTTQIRFGGTDLCDYYINIVPGDGGDSLKDGEPLKSPSYLYRGRSAVPGVAVAPSRFKLS